MWFFRYRACILVLVCRSIFSLPFPPLPTTMECRLFFSRSDQPQVQPARPTLPLPSFSSFKWLYHLDCRFDWADRKAGSLSSDSLSTGLSSRSQRQARFGKEMQWQLLFAKKTDVALKTCGDMGNGWMWLVKICRGGNPTAMLSVKMCACPLWRNSTSLILTTWCRLLLAYTFCLFLKFRYWAMCTACGHRMAYRKWKETKVQPGTAGPGNMLGCCLISFHFL